ncbi:hypothetical protein FHG87_015962 [Trinorchestia longiramus]|nr:hypothetical protein FHG87_015962 [Trinorchestia longiramus]
MYIMITNFSPDLYGELVNRSAWIFFLSKDYDESSTTNSKEFPAGIARTPNEPQVGKKRHGCFSTEYQKISLQLEREDECLGLPTSVEDF